MIFIETLAFTRLITELMKDDVNGYATLKVQSGQIDLTTDLARVYGVYPTRTKAKARVVEITRTFELCPKLMGIENGKGACFSYSLGRCRGACIGEESAELYDRRFELALEHHKVAAWPYRSAVAVPVNAAGEQVVINNWIIEGYINADGEQLFDSSEPTFDVDEYKIIKRFLRENKQLIRLFAA